MWAARDHGTVGLAFPVQPHLRHSSGAVVAWFTEPPGGVIQLTRPVRGTRELAEWLVGPAWEQLCRRFPNACEFFIVLDLSQMDGRDPSARAALLEKAQALRPGILRAAVIPPIGATAVYLSSLRVAVAILRVFGVVVDIDPSLRNVLASRGLRVASLRTML